MHNKKPVKMTGSVRLNNDGAAFMNQMKTLGT